MSLLGERIAAAAEGPGGQDYKTRLQELAARRFDQMPRYEVREGTTSRTPEAVTLRVQDGVFVPVGEFRRDPL